MRPKRLALGLLLTAALVPVTWVHVAPSRPVADPVAAIVPIGFKPQRVGAFQLVGAWEITSRDAAFGGFSALVTLPGGGLLAGSDSGRKLMFQRPDSGDAQARFGWFGPRSNAAKQARDLESLVRDPARGTIWGGYEGSNRIVRFTPDLAISGRISPPEMREWGSNSGPEAFARLADGRFLVIEEGTDGWGSDRHRALLFAGDPVAGAGSRPLALVAPEGFRPVELAPLDKGRALILFRRFELGLPPRFETIVGLVDVDRRTAEGVLRAQVLARFAAPVPQDNYEGMTVTRDPDGTHVWLISDDNLAAYQRTLLLKLAWPQRQKARE